MTVLASLLDEPPLTKRGHQIGKVISICGPIIKARIPSAAIGDRCTIATRDGEKITAQVIAFIEDEISLAVYEEPFGISPGAAVFTTNEPASIQVSEQLIGRVIDPLANILIGPLQDHTRSSRVSLMSAPPPALERTCIETQFHTGIKVIDGLCSLGIGQRIGLFAEAGVGKSTLLGRISNSAQIDVSVIALVGERGREVNEFLQNCLGPDGRKKSVVVVATSDESAAKRAMAVETATTIASYFRAKGKRVLLCVDSLTRVARALREIGLAAGELPVRQGMTPSVYAKLPKLLEQCGTAKSGSITAIYTVLTNSEGEIDPLAEEVKSILDGHITLSKKVALAGIRPSVDLSNSVSRLFERFHDNDYLMAAQQITTIVEMLYREKELLIFGGVPGPELKAALEVEADLKKFLNQGSNSIPLERTKKEVSRLAEKYRRLIG